MYHDLVEYTPDYLRTKQRQYSQIKPHINSPSNKKEYISLQDYADQGWNIAWQSAQEIEAFYYASNQPQRHISLDNSNVVKLKEGEKFDQQTSEQILENFALGKDIANCNPPSIAPELNDWKTAADVSRPQLLQHRMSIAEQNKVYRLYVGRRASRNMRRGIVHHQNGSLYQQQQQSVSSGRSVSRSRSPRSKRNGSRPFVTPFPVLPNNQHKGDMSKLKEPSIRQPRPPSNDTRGSNSQRSFKSSISRAGRVNIKHKQDDQPSNIDSVKNNGSLDCRPPWVEPSWRNYAAQAKRPQSVAATKSPRITDRKVRDASSIPPAGKPEVTADQSEENDNNNNNRDRNVIDNSGRDCLTSAAVKKSNSPGKRPKSSGVSVTKQQQHSEVKSHNLHSDEINIIKVGHSKALEYAQRLGAKGRAATEMKNRQAKLVAKKKSEPPKLLPENLMDILGEMISSLCNNFSRKLQALDEFSNVHFAQTHSSSEPFSNRDPTHHNSDTEATCNDVIIKVWEQFIRPLDDISHFHENSDAISRALFDTLDLLNCVPNQRSLPEVTTILLWLLYDRNSDKIGDDDGDPGAAQSLYRDTEASLSLLLKCFKKELLYCKSILKRSSSSQSDRGPNKEKEEHRLFAELNENLRDYYKAEEVNVNIRKDNAEHNAELSVQMASDQNTALSSPREYSRLLDASNIGAGPSSFQLSPSFSLLVQQPNGPFGAKHSRGSKSTVGITQSVFASQMAVSSDAPLGDGSRIRSGVIENCESNFSNTLDSERFATLSTSKNLTGERCGESLSNRVSSNQPVSQRNFDSHHIRNGSKDPRPIGRQWAEQENDDRLQQNQENVLSTQKQSAASEAIVRVQMHVGLIALQSCLKFMKTNLNMSPREYYRVRKGSALVICRYALPDDFSFNVSGSDVRSKQNIKKSNRKDSQMGNKLALDSSLVKQTGSSAVVDSTSEKEGNLINDTADNTDDVRSDVSSEGAGSSDNDLDQLDINQNLGNFPSNDCPEMEGFDNQLNSLVLGSEFPGLTPPVGTTPQGSLHSLSKQSTHPLPDWNSKSEDPHSAFLEALLKQKAAFFHFSPHISENQRNVMISSLFFDLMHSLLLVVHVLIQHARAGRYITLDDMKRVMGASLMRAVAEEDDITAEENTTNLSQTSAIDGSSRNKGDSPISGKSRITNAPKNEKKMSLIRRLLRWLRANRKSESNFLISSLGHTELAIQRLFAFWPKLEVNVASPTDCNNQEGQQIFVCQASLNWLDRNQSARAFKEPDGFSPNLSRI